MLRCKYISVLSFLILSMSSLAAQDTAALLADINEISSEQAGLCTVLHPSNDDLILALASNGKRIVHGICSDVQTAAKIRIKIGETEVAGNISVEPHVLKPLPYNARSVDLIVGTADPTVLIKQGLDAADIMRVLTPYGKLCLAVTAEQKNDVKAWLDKAKISDYTFVKKSQEWLFITKPRNKGLDDWSHRGHGADGNPVSRDQVLEAPTLLQWIVGPTRNYGRGDSGVLAHRPNGVISANGRNYYVMGHNIAARNSFNGVALWIKYFGSINMSLVVADENSLFLNVNGKLLELDGRTGETKRTLAENAKFSQLLVSDGYVLGLSNGGVKAFNLKDGKEAWAHSGRLGSLRIKDGNIYAIPASGSLACFNLSDGKELWKADTSGVLPEKAGLALVSDERLVFIEKQKKATPVFVFDAKDGKKLWSMQSDRGGSGVFAANGHLWVEHVSPKKPKKGVNSLWIGYDIKSGSEKFRNIGPANVKYRCHPVYATDRFMIANRPLYFMDWKTGEAKAFEATRAQCGTAYILAQGMFFGLYTTPGKCMCISTAIAGITAFAADGSMNGEIEGEKENRLVLGKAQAPTAEEEDANDLWSIYRKDARRSSSTAAAVPSQLKLAWKNTLKEDINLKKLLMQDWKVSRPSGDRISAPTVGGGKTFVALTHEHQVKAIDVKTGKTTWTVHTPARVTAPPAYYKGLCIYGCHNGWVYCVRADNGESVWSFRAAPGERRMMAYGQLESAWPIAGGVLLVDNLAYVVAGRLTETDGGLYISALEPQTGKLVWSERRGRVDGKPFGAYQPRRVETYVGAVDMLTSDGKIIGMAGSHRGRMDCKTGAAVNHYNHAIPFGWNPTRFRTDQYGTRTVPVAYLKKSYIGVDRKTKAIRRYGNNGWNYSPPSGSRVESIVAITDNAQEVKVSNWRPSAQAVLVSKAPNIDGKIDAAFEKQGTPLHYVYLNGRKNKQREATTAWMLCDKENLYIAFRCAKKDPNNVVAKKTKRDDGVWQDEAVEIFLDPKNTRTKSYIHIIINSQAVIQDMLNGNKKWDGEFIVKAGKEEAAWTVEIQIPFNSIGVDLAKDKIWSVNLNRSARKVDGTNVDEDTAWSATNTDSSHMPDMFGYVWMSAAQGGDDQSAFDKWQAGLPKKPVQQKKAEGSFERLLLAAMAKDSKDMTKGGELHVLSLDNGKLLSKCDLPCAPAHDGIAVAGGKVFVTLRDTTVVCLSGE